MLTMPVPQNRRMYAIPRILWLLLAIALSFVLPAQAVIRKIDPGAVPKLAADEALLLIVVDTETDLEKVSIARNGVNLDVRSMRSLDKGRTAQLFAVPVGRYRWSSVGLRISSGLRVDFRSDEEYEFDVKPGRINYPGDLLHRLSSALRRTIHVSNRGLLAMDWLQAQHPTLYRDYVFEYTGHYPDPFPGLYREATIGRMPSPDRTLPVPPHGTLPIPIEALWRPGQLEFVELSPAGDLLAQVVSYKREDKWQWAIDLVDLKSETTVRLYESPKKVSRLDWAGGRTLIMSIGDDHELDALMVLNMSDAADGRKYELALMPRVGLLIKVLHDQPGLVLFQSFDSAGVLQVHRIDVRNKAALKKFDFAGSTRLNRGVKRDLRWYADAQGRMRAALATDKDGARVLMHGLDGEFRQVLKFDEDNDFQPVALSASGDLIYGVTDKDRDQRDLVEFDPVAGKITRTIFSKRGVDIEGPLLDEAGTLIGASYYRDGLLFSDYFEKSDAAIDARLRAAFPDKSVSILQRDAAARHFVVAVGGSDQPTNIYVFDRAASRAMLVSETMPWLAQREFAPSHTVRAKSKDGLDIEAYLTVPRTASAKHPLLVFPHGGPIGIRDSRFFDPEVQFLASLGYAVLQVNFRGSEGFGTAFRKAGERSYGSAIEDDVDAALSAALAKYPLDDKRMCAMGASYGGYSAMVSAIRWPGRFRCAISIAGVSDRALFFTASDAGRTKEGRKLLEERIGDPKTEMDEMRTFSPLYRHRELDLPVMLIHGGEDFRVDYEHTRRLLRMLNLVDRPPVLIELKDEGHGIEGDDSRNRVWEGIAGFLRMHLGDPLKAN
jgi:acetyl esterase/lipase